MKRIALFILTIMAFILVSCRPQRSYKFLQDVSKITTIEIVQLEYDAYYSVTISEILSSIEDKERFLNDFSQVSCYSQSPPGGVEPGVKAIKILYNNGEYELVNEFGRTRVVYSELMGEGLHSMSDGPYYLDEEEFNDLIEKYMQEVE